MAVPSYVGTVTETPAAADTHTHTPTPTHTRTNTDTHTHTLTHPITQYTQAHTHARTQTQPYKHTHSPYAWCPFKAGLANWSVIHSSGGKCTRRGSVDPRKIYFLT